MTPQVYNDLGNLLLAFVMLWAYLQYFQYLLIWAGNLSDEIPWYLERTNGALATGGGAARRWRVRGAVLVPPVPPVEAQSAHARGDCRLAHRDAPGGRLLADRAAIRTGRSVCHLAGPDGDTRPGWRLASDIRWRLAARPLLASNDPRLPIALEAARELA